MRPGDLVELLEPTMGCTLASGVRGIIIKKTQHSDDNTHDLWQVLVNGKIKKISSRLIKKIK